MVSQYRLRKKLKYLRSKLRITAEITTRSTCCGEYGVWEQFHIVG
ncbi:hypothetical protein RO3G_03448 [Rhizopus delemar RA 99-880]|uniref:Uncharacterized protein n=1 Tax=Rhizopus delemar (strain RA 99-880 / ATCC MYA-4621 / FGSC 9543 / NRRL 43880) TaxID=246409 RepID=I1BRB3_RHIO9|nr:hypothetical protein RO3G_03448 [Rhizopus delemar RA 99-880]|eukprot:EIE78743.1 hypothetical protein RO3G_03448 [Rhizopus delemar RA 99-880]